MTPRDLLTSIVVSDIDGTQTNGDVVYHDNGKRSRAFNVIDGHGVELLQKNGFTVLFMSAENDKHIIDRANKLGVAFIHAPGDKYQTLLTHLFMFSHIDTSGLEYYAIGDDVNDYRLLKFAALAATPRDSILSNLNTGFTVLEKRGGQGAFREFAEMVLMSNGIDPYKRIFDNDAD